MNSLFRGHRCCRVVLLAVFIAGSRCAGAQANGSSPATVQDQGEPDVDSHTGPHFDVATIRLAAPSPDGHTHINYPAGGRFSAINITLPALMEWAYDTPQKQILDGPAWINSTRFDIEAQSDPETDGMLRAIDSSRSRDLKRQMVRVLLESRFDMKLHTETRTLPAYDLVVAKGGSKLQPSQANGKSVGVSRTYFHGQGLTTQIIAQELSQIVGRVVVDRTNLPDRYDLKLQWTPDDVPMTDDAAPSLFTAIDEQLGLKLQPAKEPVPVLIIDHVDQPSPN